MPLLQSAEAFLSRSGKMSKERDSAEINVLGRVSGYLEKGRRVHGRLVQFVSIEGRNTRMFIKNSELSHPSPLFDRLLDAGFPPANTTAKLMQKKLLAAIPKRPLPSSGSDRLHGSQYVLADGSVIGSGDHLLYQPALEDKPLPREKGTAESWSQEVAQPARHSSPMMFSIALAFSGLLLREAKGARGTTFHLTSPEAGAGKTLCQLAAQSVLRPAFPSHALPVGCDRHWPRRIGPRAQRFSSDLG